MALNDQLAKLPIAARVGVGVALLALGGVAYYVMFYGDLASAIQAAKSREAQLSGELAEARKAEFAYQKDLAELTDRQQRQRELNKVLPVTSEYPAFLSAVQNVANVAGVDLIGWTPSTEVPDQFYVRVPMRLELSGRYHQIAKFFYGVSQLDRIINLENVNLGHPEVHGEDVIVHADVLATAFRAGAEAKDVSPDKRGAAQGQPQ
ncbi:MAG TPA: type 4a pilus biogenesis protein PilO [Polyangiaceae bacterium]|nr:type 4a pilus biogenesis protein PilO [Polyangiaceae bacterium]